MTNFMQKINQYCVKYTKIKENNVYNNENIENN